MKKIRNLGLSLLLITSLFTGCGSSSNYADNSIGTIEVETEAPTELTPTNQKVSDTGNFLKVRGDMSPEEIVELMGIPTAVDTDLNTVWHRSGNIVYSYWIDPDEINLPNSELLSGIGDSLNYTFYFDKNTLSLYEWVMEAPVNTEFIASTRRSNIIKFMYDTIFPCFKTDYPELELDLDYCKEPDVPDAYTYWLAMCNDSRNKRFVIEYEDSDAYVQIMFRYFSNGSGSSGNYDTNDSYYKNNDSNNDGYIDDKEFQNAIGDWMDDHGY